MNANLAARSRWVLKGRESMVEKSEAGLSSEDQLVHDWFASLLFRFNDSLPEETQKQILKGCSAVHYEHIHMDDLISPYRGDLAGFLQFLAEKWGWLVTYDPETNTITADENKSECVCPVVRLNPGLVSPTLCHCSEGFAERMFSKVVGKPVQAQVLRSILRGGSTCVYQIRTA